MRYLGEDELTDLMGIGYPGEVRMGPGGNLYQWEEGVDGLGNPVGFWSALKKIAKRALPIAKRALPVVAPFIPGGAAVTTGLKLLRHPRAQPLLRRVLPYAAPFIPGGPQVATGLRVLKALRGRRRPIRRGLRRERRHYAPYIPRRPSAFRAASPYRRQARFLGANGLGALYQAPDGTLYQVQGLGEDEDLYGLAEDEELYGLAEDEELYGLAEDEELYGFAEDEELYGFAEDEELYGFAEDEDLYGLAEDEDLYGLDGYIREDGMSGLEAYIPDKPAGTRKFVQLAQPPEIWKPLW